MSKLTPEDVKSLGKSVSLDIDEPELTEVTMSLNAIIQAIEEIDVPGMNAAESSPIVPPRLERDVE